MDFCDDCGSLMRREGAWMVCSRDGCEGRTPVDEELVAAFTSTEEQAETAIIETDDTVGVEGLPTSTDVRCRECGNQEAWYTLKQTASADEPPTRFFKCTECGHRWREYN